MAVRSGDGDSEGIVFPEAFNSHLQQALSRNNLNSPLDDGTARPEEK